MAISMTEARDATASQLGTIAFVDASAMVALADRDDVSHAAAVDGYRELIDSGFRLMTSDLALTEAHELLVAALGEEPARLWLSRCRIDVQCIAAADVAAARQAISEGTASPRATLAEAVHLAMLDRLEITDVFAVDRAFLALLG